MVPGAGGEREAEREQAELMEMEEYSLVCLSFSKNAVAVIRVPLKFAC